jgi:hypothetical protein
MTAWIKIRRNQMILGGLIVVLLAAAYFMMGSGGGSSPTGPVTLPGSGSTQPTASPATGHKAKKKTTKSTLVLTGRNPFQCIVCPPAPQSSPSSGSSNTTTNTVTSNGLYAGGANTNVAGHSVWIHGTYKRGGTIHAQVTVDDTTYAPAVGQRFASNFKLVSAGGGCARILYGDSSFTLCV